MTQEELDALMGGDLDFSEDEKTVDALTGEEEPDEEAVASGKEGAEESRLPLPATDENKMVHQLDDVTKESEAKATEIFDIIEGISGDLMDKEEELGSVVATLESNIKLFSTLNEKFPEVEAFQTQLTKNEEALKMTQGSIEVIQMDGDSIMNVMDIMQYQDIHRQKIERVINVMRSLSKYMNTLFEGKIEDSKRVSSAVHIDGDTHNDVASADDIEALLEQFGK